MSPTRKQAPKISAPKRPAYSVSSLMVYEACPLQYYTTFVRGIPPPVSQAMRTGASVHALIAKHFRQKLFPDEIDPHVQAMLDDFRRSRFNATPVAIEKPFVLPFERGDVRGRIDLVLPGPDGGLEIVDFKSGSSRPPEDVGRWLQLPLYALAAARRFNLPPEDVSYTYYFLGDRVEVSFPAAATVAPLTARVDGLLAAIQEGRFQPAPDCDCHACRWESQFRRRKEQPEPGTSETAKL